MGKVIITEIKNRLLLVLFDERKPVFMQTAPLLHQDSLLGNIYIARVQDVVKSINGVFLTIKEQQTVYLPLTEKNRFLCANRQLEEGDIPRQGDELVVQVTGEALKTKQPTCSGNLSLTGQYCVCNYFGHGITISKKLDTEKKALLEDAVKEAELPGRKKYKFTIRTNAGSLTDFKPLLDEMALFIKTFDELTDCYQHRKVYSCLYRTDAEIMKLLQDLPLDAYEEVVTDIEAFYELLKAYSVPSSYHAPVSRVLPMLTEQQTYLYQNKPIRFYMDEQLSLSKLYSLETHLEEALSKRVWLPCGGYLIIEPTEAMIVIDVNSGKTENRDKKNENYFLKVNLEAAKEIARQLRLRNYSGMIMVDFINMESKIHKQKLMSYLDSCLKEDKTPTRLIDMTALGIVEITRKKVNKPLADFFK